MTAPFEDYSTPVLKKYRNRWISTASVAQHEIALADPQNLAPKSMTSIINDSKIIKYRIPAAVEVREWMSNFIPNFIIYVVIHTC